MAPDAGVSHAASWPKLQDSRQDIGYKRRNGQAGIPRAVVKSAPPLQASSKLATERTRV
jgi:hypothetical protein